MLSTMLRDLRAAVRLLTHRPGFCLAIILTLGIALGSATAIFSLLHALILRPLPFAKAERLVMIEPVIGGNEGRLALREYRDLERDSTAFDGWAAYYRSQYNVTGGGPPEALICTIGTATLFDVLGIKPLVGQAWPVEQDFTRQYLVMLSHHVWQQRFGGHADAVGSTITMDGGAYRVMGVLPPGFDYPVATDVFRAITDYNLPHVRRYSALARIREGRTLADAQAELDAFAERFARDYPDTNVGVSLRATQLRDAYVGPARPFLWLLAGAVTLLLLIACVNVTNLLLSRAISSSGESAIKLALGASRRHLVRQSIVEALLLTGIGAVLGGLAARWVLRAMTALIRADLPPWFRIEFDGTVLLVATIVAAVTGIVVGALPAIQASKTDLERVLRQEAGRAVSSLRQLAAQRALLGGQAAFATLLLVAATLFAGTFRELLRIDPGFDAARVLTFRLDPPWGRYPDIWTTSEFYRRLTEQLATVPGVETAGTNNFLPFSGLDVSSPRLAVEGSESGRADEQPFANFQLVDPNYFRAMAIPLHRGRVFERTDTEQSAPVAIVSERAARRFWGDRDPINRRVRVLWNQSGTGSGGGSEMWLTVVGVVGDVRFDGVDDDDGLDVYASNAQLFAGDSYVAVRTQMDPTTVGPQLRAAIDAVDPEQSFFDVQSMRERVDGSIWQHRVATTVLGLFAAIALSLAVIGIYSVAAYAVASQRREISIRLALGSSGSSIGWLMMRRWLTPTAVGVVVGLMAGVGGARALAAVIGVSGMPTSLWPTSLPLLLAAAATVACYLPIRRVLRHVRLTDALRAE